MNFSVIIVNLFIPIPVFSAALFTNLFLWNSHLFFLSFFLFIGIKHLTIFHPQILADLDEDNLLLSLRLGNFMVSSIVTIWDVWFNYAGNTRVNRIRNRLFTIFKGYGRVSRFLTGNQSPLMPPKSTRFLILFAILDVFLLIYTYIKIEATNHVANNGNTLRERLRDPCCMNSVNESPNLEGQDNASPYTFGAMRILIFAAMIAGRVPVKSC